MSLSQASALTDLAIHPVSLPVPSHHILWAPAEEMSVFKGPDDHTGSIWKSQLTFLFQSQLISLPLQSPIRAVSRLVFGWTITDGNRGEKSLEFCRPHLAGDIPGSEGSLSRREQEEPHEGPPPTNTGLWRSSAWASAPEAANVSQQGRPQCHKSPEALAWSGAIAPQRPHDTEQGRRPLEPSPPASGCAWSKHALQGGGQAALFAFRCLLELSA